MAPSPAAAQWLRLRTLSRRYGFGGRWRPRAGPHVRKGSGHFVAKYLSKCLANDLGPRGKGSAARKAAFKPRREVSSQFAWAGLVASHGKKHRNRIDQIAHALGLGADDMLRIVAGDW